MKKDIVATNRRRSILAIVLCGIIVASVFTGVVIKLVAPSTIEDPYEGIRSFRYFTVLSNILMAFGTTLCIPFIVDGLRNHNYHLPRWAVGTFYCGVSCVTITFTIALCMLSPIAGFEVTMLQKANLFLHLISPVAAMALFIVINNDHYLPFRYSFLVLIPLLIYVFIYWYEVFVLGESDGGWKDLYYTNTFFPYWIAMVALPVIGVALSNLIRVLHNRFHNQYKNAFEDYYLNSPDFACSSIEEAIEKLAEREKVLDKGGEIIVPRRIIIILEKRYKSGLPLDKLCNIYVNSYLKIH